MTNQSNEHRDLEAERDEILAKAVQEISPEILQMIRVAEALSVRPTNVKIVTSSTGSAGAHT